MAKIGGYVPLIFIFSVAILLFLFVKDNQRLFDTKTVLNYAYISK